MIEAIVNIGNDYMKRILDSFKNLYKGMNIVKIHLCICLLFIFPALLGAYIEFLDKDFKEYMTQVLNTSLILLVLSIIPMLFILGFYFKFLNKRLYEPAGIPDLDLDCLVKGIKALPVFLVWMLYTGIPILVVFSFFYEFGVFLISNKDLLSVVLLISLCFIFITIVSIYYILISPFVQFIYISYAKNFQYSAKIFDPVEFFNYVKKSFKDALMVSLKFVLVNLLNMTVSQIIVAVVGCFGIVLGIIFQFASNPFIGSIIVSTLIGILHCYLILITTLAYADNLIDVYKTKIEKISIPINNNVKN